MRKYYPWFNPAEGRWNINGRELHCGDCFQLRHAGTDGPWHDVRIEHTNDTFYVIGLPPGSNTKDLDIYEARLYDT